jgi:hypothetical protein
MARRPEVVLLAGRNGTGKTTLARHLVSRLPPESVAVVSPSGEWGRWAKEPATLATDAVRAGARALVLDDVDAYLAGQTSEFWRRLLATNRHLGLDVLLCSRRPQELPMWAVAAASRAYLLPLGPRESAWCRRVLGAAPPASGHIPVVVTL